LNKISGSKIEFPVEFSPFCAILTVFSPIFREFSHFPQIFQKKSKKKQKKVKKNKNNY